MCFCVPNISLDAVMHPQPHSCAIHPPILPSIHPPSLPTSSASQQVFGEWLLCARHDMVLNSSVTLVNKTDMVCV